MKTQFLLSFVLAVIILKVIALTLGIIAINNGGTLPNLLVMPHCQEDEIIIGMGDFNGRTWDDYQCKAYDDILEEAMVQ